MKLTAKKIALVDHLAKTIREDESLLPRTDERLQEFRDTGIEINYPVGILRFGRLNEAIPGCLLDLNRAAVKMLNLKTEHLAHTKSSCGEQDGEHLDLAIAGVDEMVSCKPQGDPENDGCADSESGIGVTIVWEFWKTAQSQFRYRAAGIVELGDVDAEVVDYAPILAKLD